VHQSGAGVSIQDNVDYVKKELSGDEKVLESALKIETFYKKHKIKIWAAIAAIILLFAGKAIIDTVHEVKLNSANEAFLTLQKDPKNSEALEVLKSKNPALYELYAYAEAVKSKDKKILEGLGSSKNALISDISRYHSNVLAAAVEWAIDEGASILNQSQGLKTSSVGEFLWSDIYYDYVVFYSRVLFSKSPPCSERIRRGQG